MHFRFILAIGAIVCLAGCSPDQRWYPPPVQYVFSAEAEPRMVGAFASMDDGFIENYIVSGVLKGERGSSWRWANDKVELRFQLGDLKPKRFVIDFVIPHSTFELTGPVKVTLQLDGKPYGMKAVDKPGQQDWAVPVDAARLSATAPIVATIQVDKFYTSEHDGTKLGLMLQRAGFE